MKLVLDIDPRPGNARNSEGSFIRMPDGGILFAYSRYSSDTAHDADSCDIAVIRSFDEGETWSEPEIIVKAANYGVKNVMSVSCIYQQDGQIGVYFLIKENDRSTNLGRAISPDGYSFIWERCTHDSCSAFYVINNDRVERFADGRLVVPAARHIIEPARYEEYSQSVIWVSEDDGKTFHVLPHRLSIPKLKERDYGMQEPGIVEYEDGSVYLWARTTSDYQYESYSYDHMKTFTEPKPSIFASPCSPMEIAKNPETSIYYAIYNPYPSFRGDRTPFVVRTSKNQGKIWSMPTVIEEDKERGYCYPAVFFTKDNAMLCAYCRGGKEDPNCLARLGIMKIGLDEMEYEWYEGR